MTRFAVASLLLALVVASSTTGCASSCSATPDKLAALKRGMSYGEATGVMGCTGTQVTPNGPDTAEMSSVEWDGPEHGILMITANSIPSLTRSSAT